MYAHAVLTFLSPSIPFAERTLSLEKPVRVVRSNIKTRPNTHNAVFDCKCMSRHHANLWFEDDNFWVSDMKSSNGTYVNGKRLENDITKVALFTGDVIQFGTTVEMSCKNRETKVTYLCVIATLQLYKPGDLSNVEAPSKTRLTTGVNASKLSINASAPPILFNSTAPLSKSTILTDSTARSHPDSNRTLLLDELYLLTKDDHGTGMNKKTVKLNMVILSLDKLCNLGAQVLPQQLQELLLTDLKTLRQDLETCVEKCDGDSPDVLPVRLDDVAKYASENENATPMQTDDDDDADIITNVEDTLNESANNDVKTKQNSGDTLEVGSKSVETAYSASALINFVRTGLTEEEELCVLRLREAETAIKSIADLVCKLEDYVKTNLLEQERIVEMANFETKRVKTNEELQELNKKVQEGKLYRDQLKEGKSILETKFATCTQLRRRSDGMRHLSAEIARKITLLEGELSKVEHLPTLTISEAELRVVDTEEEQVDETDEEMDVVMVTSGTDMLKSAAEVQRGTKTEMLSGPVSDNTGRGTKEKQVRLSGTFEYRNKGGQVKKMQGDNTKAQSDKIKPTETVKTNNKCGMSRFTTQAGKELHLRGTNLLKEKMKNVIEIQPDDGVDALGSFETIELENAREIDAGGSVGNARLNVIEWDSDDEDANQDTHAEFYGRFTRERVMTNEQDEFTQVEPSRGSINLNASLANEDDENDIEIITNVTDSLAREDDENDIETFTKVAFSLANEYYESDIKTFTNVTDSLAREDGENDIETITNVTDSLARVDGENDIETITNVTDSLANKDDENGVKTFVKDVTAKGEQKSEAAKMYSEIMIMEEAEKVAQLILSEIEPTQETTKDAESYQNDESHTEDTLKDDASGTNCTSVKDGGTKINFEIPRIYLNDIPISDEDIEGFKADKDTDAILNNTLFTKGAKTVDKIMFSEINHSGNAEVIYVNNVLIRDGVIEPLVDSSLLEKDAKRTDGSRPSEKLSKSKLKQISKINTTEKNITQSVEGNLADMITQQNVKISVTPYEPRMQYMLEEHKKPSECLMFGAVTSTEETEESAKGDDSTVSQHKEDHEEIRGGVSLHLEGEPIARGDGNVKLSLQDSEQKDETDLGKQEHEEKAKIVISKLLTEVKQSQERDTNLTVKINKETTKEIVNSTLELVQELEPNVEVQRCDGELENAWREDESASTEVNSATETKRKVETEFNATEIAAANVSAMGFVKDEILVETDSSSLGNRQPAAMEDEIVTASENTEEKKGMTDGDALENEKDSGHTAVTEPCAMEQSQAVIQEHQSGTVGNTKETKQDSEDERSESEEVSEQPTERDMITKDILDGTEKEVEYDTMELSEDDSENEIVVKVTENDWESEEIEERAREKLDETVRRATSEGITQEDEEPVTKSGDKSTRRQEENTEEIDDVTKQPDNLNGEDERVEVTEANVNEADQGESIDGNTLDKPDVTKCNVDDINGVFKLIYKARTTIRSASSKLQAEIVRRDSQLREDLLGDSTDGETDSDDDGYDQLLAEGEKGPPPIGDTDRASGEPYTSRRRLKKAASLPDVCGRPLQTTEDFDLHRSTPLRYFFLPLVIGLLAMLIGIHYIVTQE